MALEPSVSGSQYQGKRRALIISISQYDKLEPLEFCEKDGNKMYEVLEQLDYDIPSKYRLIGGKIEYNRLRDSILDFFSDPAIHPQDTILLYFTGHGVLGDDGEHYLSTSEIDPDKPRKRGFSFDDLSKAREDCNSKTIFTILDCCYAGAHRSGAKGDDESANAAKILIENKSKPLGEGKCILTACKPMQKAYEYKEKGHSFFTFYLAEALGKRECVDEDGDITPELVSRYIDYKLRILPENLWPKQTPLLDCRTAGKIILAHYPNEVIKPSDHLPELDPKFNHVHTAEKWIHKGLSLSASGQNDDAIACFDRAIDIEPNNPYAWYNKGISLRDSDKPDAAIACFDRAIKIHPNNAHAWIDKGFVLGALQRYDESIACFDRAIKIHPNDADILYKVTDVIFMLGIHEIPKYYDKAKKYYDKAKKLGYNSWLYTK